MKRAPRHALRAVPLSFVAALLVVLALGIGLFAAPPAAHGAAYAVNFGGDTDDGACQALNLSGQDCTLREAINAANVTIVADTITFTAGAALAGMVSPTLALPTITKPLTINGAIPVSPVTGSDKFRIDGVSAGSTPGLYATASLTAQNLIITRFAGAGIHLVAAGGVSGSIIGTDASGVAGLDNDRGIYAGSGTVAVSGTTVRRNVATTSGAGIYINGGTVTLTNSTVSNNTAGGGGGGGIYINGGTLTLTNSTVSNNTAGFGGGGIYIAGGAGLTVTNTTVTNNTASGGGGVYNDGTLTLTGGGVGSNFASDLGGGIFSLGTLTLTNSGVDSNQAGREGGGILNGGTLTLTNSGVQGNVAGERGGGIFNDGILTLSNSALVINQANLDAGGIFNDSGGAATLTNSMVRLNEGFGVGPGGINNYGNLTLTNSAVTENTGSFSGGINNLGTLTVADSTISGNTAIGNGGGGIYSGFFQGIGSAAITNSTISGNTANGGGSGGIYRGGGTVTLKNTILAGNFHNDSPDCVGVLTSQGYNIIETMSAGCTVSGVTTGNVTGQSADLGLLAFNAPGTTQTHALLAGSPAIDAGSPGCPPPATDQRGVARPAGNACDIGAYESAFAATPTPTPTATPIGQTPSPTPTATPIGQTPSPTPTPTPIPTATPIGQTPSPTPTATPIGQTPTATPTATPIGQDTPTPSPPLFKKGNVNCDGAVTSVDALQVLRHVANLPVSQNPGCPEIGGATAAALEAVAGTVFGDVDCDGAVNSVDALKILRYVAGLPVSQPQGCPPIGV